MTSNRNVYHLFMLIIFFPYSKVFLICIIPFWSSVHHRTDEYKQKHIYVHYAYQGQLPGCMFWTVGHGESMQSMHNLDDDTILKKYYIMWVAETYKLHVHKYIINNMQPSMLNVYEYKKSRSIRHCMKTWGETRTSSRNPFWQWEN